MAQLQPPPYQDAATSQRWAEWYRQVNILLADVSISINSIDDVVILGVTDNELFVWNSSSATWINQTRAEASIQTAGDILDDLNTLGAVTGDNEVLISTAAGVVAWEGVTALLASLGLDDDLQTLALPASTTISTFGASLVDDADAAAGRATLGFAANAGAGTTVVTATTHTHAVAERYLICDTSSNAITVNLLAASTAGDGYRLDIKVVNATNTTTIDGDSSETIDGSTTIVLSTIFDHLSLLCDGSNWHIV